MDYQNAADFANSAIDLVSTSLGIDRKTVEAEFIKSNDGKGEITFAAPDVIKSYGNKYVEKFKNLSTDEISAAEQSARKEAYEKIETQIFELTGVKGTLNNGLLTQAIESQKSIKMDPKEVKNSEVYKADIAELNRQILEAKEQGQSDLIAMQQLRNRDLVRQSLVNWAKDSANNLVLPEGDNAKLVFDAKIDDFLNRVYNTTIDGKVPVISANEKGEIVYKTKDGLAMLNSMKEPINHLAHIQEIGTTYHFDVRTAQQRQTPDLKGQGTGGGKGIAGQVTVGETTYDVPKLKDQAEARSYMFGPEFRGYPPEARDAIRKYFDEQFKE